MSRPDLAIVMRPSAAKAYIEFNKAGVVVLPPASTTWHMMTTFAPPAFLGGAFLFA